MSNIQDALQVLQESNGKSSKKDDSLSESAIRRMATVVDTSEEPSTRVRPIVEVDRAALYDAGFIASADQQRQLADQYRIIKRPLLNNASGRAASEEANAHLIMITSALPGDGKTFNCINLALSIATEKDRSVLLVDADVAKPHISSLFGMEDRPGLIDVLESSDSDVRDCILDTDVPGLQLLPAGQPNEHATELLASRRMVRMLEELTADDPDRIVIFDSSPLLVTSEAGVIAGLMGQIVLVVCSGRTPRQAVIEAADSLDSDRIINILMNQAYTGLGSSTYGHYGAYGSFGAAGNRSV